MTVPVQNVTSDQPEMGMVEQIDQFVERQRQDQQLLEDEKRRNNQSISDLISQSKPLPPEIVNQIFNPYLKQKIPVDSVQLVRKTLHTMRLKINALDVKKRFLILETMDFFRSSIGIGKLIPAILLAEGEDQKKIVLQFILPTFNSIKNNIETLVSTDELFTNESIHLNRGSLYSFVSDLARIILPIFKKSYLKQFPSTKSPVEFIHQTGRAYLANAKTTDSSLLQHITDDSKTIRDIILNFIVAIQSHNSLFNYAVKKHAYYKLFLNRLTKENRFENVEPLLASKILAGCFLGNKQVKPSNSLINAMVDQESYATAKTEKAKKRFIDKLAPTTVFSIISQFKSHLKIFLKSAFSEEFSDVQELSTGSILKKVWNGFTKLAEEGLSRLSAPLEIVLNQIKRTFRYFIEEENTREEKIRRNLESPFVPLIQKRKESTGFLKKNFEMVEPNISGFRGVREGASQKDFAYNARLFNNDEVIILEFNYCFKRLFEYLSQNRKTKRIAHDRQRKVVEYHVSFIFENQLINLGLTRIKSDAQIEVQEKDIFPYILFFTESQEEERGRLPSRKVIGKSEQRIFNESVMTKKNSIVLLKSVLYILHLLPIEDWNSSASQSCLKFLISELKRLSS